MKKTIIFAVILGILIFVGWFVFTEYLYVVPILTYHHIDEAMHKDCPTVLTENFQEQMEYIHKKGYRVITLDELVEAIKSNRKLPRNSVVITIDDGYEDNYVNAFPIFKKYNFPATIFIITKKIGQDSYLSWDQVKEMNQEDIAFGGHTRTHAYLPEVKDNQLKDEILGSKKDIEERLNVEVEYFCYPIGGFSDKVIEVVKESGYKGACTTNRGNNRFNKDVYALQRIKISNSDTNAFKMWAKLSGFYNLLRSEKSPY